MWFTDALGNSPSIVPVGYGYGLQTTPQATTLLFDPFNGAALDTVNRWNTPVTAGAGAVTLPGTGICAITTGTAASAAAALSSIEAFQSAGPGPLLYGAACFFETPIITGCHRFIGVGTPNASFTALTPLANAYGWELDVTGLLNAVTYSNNVRTIWGQTTAPTDGQPHLLIAQSRADYVLFYKDNLAVPLFKGGYSQPNTSQLPMRLHMINGTATLGGTPVFSNWAAGVFDTAGIYTTAFNGQSFSATRTPGKFIALNNLVVTSETTIWTPAAGKKFRLMGFCLTGGVAAGNVVLKDNTAGTSLPLVLPFGTIGANITMQPPAMGNGILSATANNVLTATGASTQTLSGYLIGCEE